VIYHVDDSGRIVAVLAGQTVEQEAQALAAGLRVIEDDGVYDREAYVHVDGVFAPIPAPSAAEQLATAATAKRLALARQAEGFVARLTPPELAAVRAADPSRTDERYTGTWLAWARGQNDLATIIAGHAAASPEQIARAELVKLRYLALTAWAARITAGPLATAFAALAAAVTAGDLAAVEALSLDLSAYMIGATGEGADPDPDITQDMLWLPPAGLALIAEA